MATNASVQIIETKVVGYGNVPQKITIHNSMDVPVAEYSGIGI